MFLKCWGHKNQIAFSSSQLLNIPFLPLAFSSALSRSLSVHSSSLLEGYISNHLHASFSLRFCFGGAPGKNKMSSIYPDLTAQGGRGPAGLLWPLLLHCRNKSVFRTFFTLSSQGQTLLVNWPNISRGTFSQIGTSRPNPRPEQSKEAMF